MTYEYTCFTWYKIEAREQLRVNSSIEFDVDSAYWNSSHDTVVRGTPNTCITYVLLAVVLHTPTSKQLTLRTSCDVFRKVVVTKRLSGVTTNQVGVNHRVRRKRGKIVSKTHLVGLPVDCSWTLLVSWSYNFTYDAIKSGWFVYDFSGWQHLWISRLHSHYEMPPEGLDMLLVLFCDVCVGKSRTVLLQLRHEVQCLPTSDCTMVDLFKKCFLCHHDYKKTKLLVLCIFQ